MTIRDVWQHGHLVDRVTVPRRHMKKKVEGRTVLLHPEAKAALATWLLTLRQRREVTPRPSCFTVGKAATGRSARCEPGASCMRPW
jgi:hypothetical protein